MDGQERYDKGNILLTVAQKYPQLFSIVLFGTRRLDNSKELALNKIITEYAFADIQLVDDILMEYTNSMPHTTCIFANRNQILIVLLPCYQAIM